MYLGVKRAIDCIAAILILLLLSPLFLFLALAIKADSSGPVFFRQKRVGKGKVIFEILKFRTMRTDTPGDTPTHLLADPGRYITRIGKFLRQTSLDELPQLINIIRGEMSLVAPRPALWNETDLIAQRDRYTGRYALTANDLRPGLTGWAQINGRDTLQMEEKARLDGEYVQKMGFLFDCKCIWGTVISVLRRDGIVEGGNYEIQKEESAR